MMTTMMMLMMSMIMIMKMMIMMRMVMMMMMKMMRMRMMRIIMKMMVVVMMVVNHYEGRLCILIFMFISFMSRYSGYVKFFTQIRATGPYYPCGRSRKTETGGQLLISRNSLHCSHSVSE